jgi:death-on-curing family protein
VAIEAAREEAAATDVRVPPVTLDQCRRQTIESALYAPQTSLHGVEKYPDLPSKAAALLYALAKSQACPDGNKRVALILVMEFLAINGATLDVDPDALAQTILDVAESDPTQRDAVVTNLTNTLGPLIVPLPLEAQ